MSNFMKILSLGAELFHRSDRLSDIHDEAMDRFSQFC